MPGLDGFDTTLALRRDLRAGSIVIIAFTALDEADILGHLSHPTFDGYCQKGQPPDVLMALIKFSHAQLNQRERRLATCRGSSTSF
ncbi:hypothetical protein PAMC26577_19720 [Caballeronia sordidicola]|uniref:Response regulatory domain-containing protein n=2 Tax=Caballeronia sordidicola TaxID=196367 RepID=A0A242MNK7_CABSO|nr:hypothetical protein PAMC26577_19720 [Caballeronia sordidicola]